MPDHIQLTDADVKLVLQAIHDERIRGLDDEPYDAAAWDSKAVPDGEAVRDWLERTHTPHRAHEIVATLRKGHRIQSRPVAPTVYIALQALMRRVERLEREVAALRAQSSNRG